MLLQQASEEIVSEVRSPRHLSSSGSYPVDLPSLGDPTGSNATAGLAVGVLKFTSPSTTQGDNTFQAVCYKCSVFLWPSGLTGRN